MSTTPIRLAFQDGCAVTFSFQDAPSFHMDVGTVVHGDVVKYDGPYELTPGEEAQVLPTQGFTMAEDFVINPIPSNYGLITYDGSTITVS